MTQSAPPFGISVLPVTLFQQNAHFVICNATKRAAIVDPGGDVPQLLEGLKQTGATPEKVVLTHGHIDHAGGATELAETLGIPIEGPHEADRFLLDALPQQAAQFGMTGVRAVTPARWMAEGDTLQVGDVIFDVLHVPGHTPGHLVFVHKAARFAIVGDTLFAGSIGRTDFPYGNHAQLIEGINAKLLPLADDVSFLPGHGPASTIGNERRSNPFLQ